MTSLFPANFDTTFRTKEDSGEELSPPSGLCLTHDGNILLADDFNHRIQVYDQQFNLITSFSEKGKDQGQLQYPKGIAVDKEGNIFVADSWNHRIQKFDSQGKPLLTFGSCGDGKGELNEPYDILVDSSGVLIVVERYNHRIQFFDGNGKSLGWVGQRGTTLEENLAELLETPLNLLAPPLFEFPTSIAVDSCGNYFVTDSGNHRIRKFNYKWQEILNFGEQGEESGQFQYPLCVSIASNDLLYIADLNNNRIQVFTSFGQYLSEINHADIPLEAPCLTLTDATGNLLVGSTFDTKILKYQISSEAENILAEKLAANEPPKPEHVYFFSKVQEKNNNQPKSLAALEQTLELLKKDESQKGLDTPLRLSQLAFAGKEISPSSIELAISLIENEFNESRKKMIASHQDWQTHAQKFDEIAIKEQQMVQKDPLGLRDFNREFYTHEHEERIRYRETRRAFYSFRKTAQQLYNFIFNLIESHVSEKQLENLATLLSRQWKTTVDCINDYFDQKEKSEEAMVQLLGDSGNDQLPSFLAKYHHNCKTFDLLLHLQFPLRTHCQVLNVLARKAKDNKVFCEIFRRLTTDFSDSATRIIIRFHEDWPTLDVLESLFLEIMDAAQPYQEETAVLEPGIGDFSPVAFDSENLDIVKVSLILQSQSTEIEFKDGVLSLGPIKYKPEALANQTSELVSQCLAALEGQSIFENKLEELLNQFDDLGKQRRDLDDQLRQAGNEDKVAPIRINNNIAIMEFQLNLLRRMIKGIDINENLNLHRLVAGAAMVRVLNPSGENSQLFEKIAGYSKNLDRNILKISQERKLKNFELIHLIDQQNQLASAQDITAIDDSIKIDAGIVNIQDQLKRLELEFKNFTKTKILIDQVLKFSKVIPSTPQTRMKQVFSIRKVGSEIGLPFTPQGLARNSKGDLLVTDHEQHQIHCYSQEGKYKFHFGAYGNTSGNLKYPADLVTDKADNIFVIDEGNGVVKKFDAEGNFLLRFEEGIIGHVFSLSIDKQDRIYIADPDNNRISVFDSDGKLITLSFTGEPPQNLDAPCGIFCLDEGGIIVGDRSEYLLKHFDSGGNLVNQVDKEDLDFDDIYFLACDAEHGIFASDYWHGQIIHLNNNLEVVDAYRKRGNRTGGLGKTGGLSIHKGRLAASNVDGRKVQIFDLPD